MRLELKRFSHEVDISNPTDGKYFLVFGDEHGRDHRVPVPQETLAEVIRIANGVSESHENFAEPRYEADVSHQVHEDVEEEHPEEAEVFGGDGLDEELYGTVGGSSEILTRRLQERRAMADASIDPAYHYEGDEPLSEEEVGSL